MFAAAVRPSEEHVEEIEVLRSIYEDQVVVNAEWLSGSDGKALWHVRVKVPSSTIHPMALVVRFPSSGYPGDASAPCPAFDVVAKWLSADQRVALSKRLVELFTDGEGEAVVFAWVSALAEFVAEADESADCIVEDTAPAPAASHVAAPAPPPAPVRAVAPAVMLPTFAFVSGDAFIDRKSIFQAHLCPIGSADDVDGAMAQLLRNNKVARATHNILAYRCVTEAGVCKAEDFDDDGEHGAGKKLLRMMAVMDARNVLVVVSRWYGGVHLGPDRFRHINNVARILIESEGAAWKRGEQGKHKKRPPIDEEVKSTVDEATSRRRAMRSCVDDRSDSTVVLRVRVRPNARRGTALTGCENGYLCVDVAAAAAEGRANRELLTVLASLLRLPKQHVQLHRGHKSRSKTLHLSSTSVDDVVACLLAALPT